jgi:hypothetical protein
VLKIASQKARRAKRYEISDLFPKNTALANIVSL